MFTVSDAGLVKLAPIVHHPIVRPFIGFKLLPKSFVARVVNTTVLLHGAATRRSRAANSP